MYKVALLFIKNQIVIKMENIELSSKLKELVNKTLTEEDKIFLEKAGFVLGHPFQSRSDCQNCWSDYVQELYNIVSTMKQKKKNEALKSSISETVHKLKDENTKARLS